MSINRFPNILVLPRIWKWLRARGRLRSLCHCRMQPLFWILIFVCCIVLCSFLISGQLSVLCLAVLLYFSCFCTSFQVFYWANKWWWCGCGWWWWWWWWKVDRRHKRGLYRTGDTIGEATKLAGDGNSGGMGEHCTGTWSGLARRDRRRRLGISPVSKARSLVQLKFKQRFTVRMLDVRRWSWWRWNCCLCRR